MTRRPRCSPRSVAALALFSLAMVAPASAERPASALVVETALQRGALARQVDAYGVVTADPSVQQAIMAPVAATVGKIDVRLGQSVAKGAPLIQLVPSPTSHASYAQAQSALRVAIAGEARTKTLVQQYLATRQDLANAQKAVEDARATLDALNSVGAGGAQTLKAPFAATVTKLSTSVGALVNEGTPLLEIAPPSDLVLRVGVTPADAAHIKVGAPVKVTPVSGGNGTDLSGKVSLRGAVVDATSGLVPVEISLPANLLFPGETARAAITTTTVSGYVVPHAAVLLNTKGQPYVVQAPGGKAKLIPVHVLDSQGDRDVVAGALIPSAPIVLSGNYQLTPGMPVRLAPPSGGSK